MLKELFKSVGSVVLMVVIVAGFGLYLIFNYDNLSNDEFYDEPTAQFSISSESVLPIAGGIGIAFIVIGFILMIFRRSK